MCAVALTLSLSANNYIRAKSGHITGGQVYLSLSYLTGAEDIIAVVQDKLEHPPEGKEQKQAMDCPIGLDKVHCQTCYFWRHGKCNYEQIMSKPLPRG